MYAGTDAEERGGVWSPRDTVPIMCIRVAVLGSRIQARWI
jgi:hypothetical protein